MFPLSTLPSISPPSPLKTNRKTTKCKHISEEIKTAKMLPSLGAVHPEKGQHHMHKTVISIFWKTTLTRRQEEWAVTKGLIVLFSSSLGSTLCFRSPTISFMANPWFAF